MRDAILEVNTPDYLLEELSERAADERTLDACHQAEETEMSDFGNFLFGLSRDLSRIAGKGGF